MMRLLLAAAFLSFALVSKAQSNPQILVLDTACYKGQLFERVEQMPVYKNGSEQLIKKLNAQLKYDDTLNGKFVVRMKINCLGKIFGIEVEKGINASINSQLLNAILTCGDWLSGKQNGHPIDCKIPLFLKVVNGKIVV